MCETSPRLVRRSRKLWQQTKMLRTTLIRKTLTAAFVLLLAGLAPAAAVIGFCTRMPCCSHTGSDSVVAPDKDADCCTTVTCYDVPAAKPATSAPVANNS